MSDTTGGIPRYRAFSGPVVFRQGFRPFFLGSGVYALVVMVLWLPMLQGHLSLPTAFDPVAWHGHEMIFGAVVASIAGFLLTAIPNWTGRMPLQGPPLIVLAALWLLGRAAVLLSAWIGASVAAAIDLSFLVLLLGVVLREIVAGRNWRNLPMTLALGVLLAANLMTHLEPVAGLSTGALGLRLAIGIAIALIGLVGGRIIPSFTRNWLHKRSESTMPASAGRFDLASLGILLGAIVAWVVAPEHPASGALLLLAGAVSLVRLSRWRGHRTFSEPLVWSLHLGFVWVPIGLMLAGLAAFVGGVSATAGLHALTVGAIGGMTLAVMTRATLGHTGRPLTADGWTTAVYLAVSLAAATRVSATFFSEAYLPLLWGGAALWIVAYGIFVGRYGRLLLR